MRIIINILPSESGSLVSNIDNYSGGAMVQFNL